MAEISPELKRRYLLSKGLNPDDYDVMWQSDLDKPKEPDTQDQTSDTEAFLKSGKHSIVPTLAGGAGMGVGRAAGMALAAALAPETAGASLIPLLTTLAGGMGGSVLGSMGQEAVEKAMDGEDQHKKEQEERAKMAAAHPKSTLAGELFPQLLLARPDLKSLKDVGRLPMRLLEGGDIGKDTLRAATSAAANAGLGVATEGYNELSNEGKLDPARLGIAGAAGGILTKPWALGKYKLFGGHTTPEPTTRQTEGLNGSAESPEQFRKVGKEDRVRIGSAKDEKARLPAELPPDEMAKGSDAIEQLRLGNKKAEMLQKAELEAHKTGRAELEARKVAETTPDEQAAQRRTKGETRLRQALHDAELAQQKAETEQANLAKKQAEAAEERLKQEQQRIEQEKNLIPPSRQLPAPPRGSRPFVNKEVSPVASQPRKVEEVNTALETQQYRIAAEAKAAAERRKLELQKQVDEENYQNGFKQAYDQSNWSKARKIAGDNFPMWEERRRQELREAKEKYSRVLQDRGEQGTRNMPAPATKTQINEEYAKWREMVLAGDREGARTLAGERDDMHLRRLSGERPYLTPEDAAKVQEFTSRTGVRKVNFEPTMDEQGNLTAGQYKGGEDVSVNPEFQDNTRKVATVHETLHKWIKDAWTKSSRDRKMLKNATRLLTGEEPKDYESEALKNTEETLIEELLEGNKNADKFLGAGELKSWWEAVKSRLRMATGKGTKQDIANRLKYRTKFGPAFEDRMWDSATTESGEVRSMPYIPATDQEALDWYKAKDRIDKDKKPAWYSGYFTESAANEATKVVPSDNVLTNHRTFLKFVEANPEEIQRRLDAGTQRGKPMVVQDFLSTKVLEELESRGLFVRNVPVRIVQLDNYLGAYHPDLDIIELNKMHPNANTFLHELQHALQHRYTKLDGAVRWDKAWSKANSAEYPATYNGDAEQFRNNEMLRHTKNLYDNALVEGEARAAARNSVGEPAIRGENHADTWVPKEGKVSPEDRRGQTLRNSPYEQQRKYTHRHMRNPFEGEVDKVKASHPEVGEAFSEFYDKFGANKGKYVDGFLHPLTKALDDVSRLTGNSEKLNRITSYMDAMDRSVASPVTLTPEEVNIMEKYVKPYFKHVRDEQNSRPGMREGGYNEWYVPRTLSREVLKTFEGTDTAAKSKLRDEFIKYQVDENGLDPDKAKEEFNAVMGGFAKRGDIKLASNYGPLDKLEGLGIPDSWAEKNALARFAYYGDRTARRFAYHDAVESKEDVNEAIKDPIVNQTRAVRNVLEDINGYRDRAEATRESTLGLVKSLMLGPITGSADMLSTPFNAAKYLTPGQLLQNGAKALGDWKNNWENSFKAGANRMAIGQIEAQAANLSDRISAVRDIVNVAQGRDVLEKSARTWAFGVGRETALQNMTAAKPNAQQKSWMNKFGKEFIGQAPSEEALDTMARRFVEAVQGSYDLRNLPHWATRGTFAPFAGLMRWNMEMGNRFYKDVVKDANPTRILMAVFGTVLGGTAAQELREEMTGTKSKAATLQELQKMPPGQAMPYAYKLLTAASAVGSAGVYADMLKYMADRYYGNRTQAITNPLIDAMGNVTSDVGNLLQGAKEGMSLEDFVNGIFDSSQKYVQALRVATNMAQQSGLAPDRARDKARSNANRDERVWQQLHGMPTANQSQIEVNPFINRAIREFKRTQDLDEARKLLQEKILPEIRKLPIEIQKQRLQALKAQASVAMPSDPRLAMAYRKWRSEVGDHPLDDRKERLIDKRKSAMVPHR